MSRRGLAALLLAGVCLASEAAAQGPPVVAVELRSDVELDNPKELLSLLSVPVGEPLSAPAVRQSLRNLQASGVATEIEAREIPEGDGVRLVFALWASIQVESVEFAGTLGLKLERLRTAVTVRVEEPLIEDRVLRSVYRLQDLYRDHGYLEARVRIEVRTDEARKRAAVVFNCASGERSLVGAVTFDGELGPLTPETVVAELESRPEGRYLAQSVREDPDRLRVWLVRQGYRMAEVGAAAESPRPDAQRIDLKFPVRLGPLVEFAVEGAEEKKLRRRDLLPFLSDEGYDEALVLQAIDRIRRDYQEAGHYRVQIERHEQREGDRLELRLVIDPGPVYVLEDLRFRGNEQISSEKLNELVTISPKRFLRPGSGRLVDEVLKEDIANVRSYYALSGYGAARVGPEEVSESGDRLIVEIPVVEGPRTTVGELSFEGLTSLDEKAVRRQLPLESGGAFHALLLEESVNAVRSFYQDDGFESAQVSAVTTWNEDHSVADIRLQIFEGRRSRVDRVVIRGARVTRPGVVRRAVDLDPGETVSPRKLLEVQRELYGLGIFSRVDVELAHSGEGEAQRDVLVKLEEGRMQRVSYGVGYDSDDGARGILGYSHNNVLGRALGFQVDARYSERERLFRVLLRQPDLLRWPVPVTYSVFRTEEERESFDSQRRGFQVEAGRIIKRTRYGLLYTYRIVDLDVDPLSPGEVPEEIDRELQNIRISSLTPSVLIDHRDDPISPTRGWSGASQIEWAAPLLSAEEAFLKFFIQGTWQRTLRRGGVIAASARVGAIEPLSDSAEPDPSLPPELETAEVPISERLFAGGRTTHRAYARDLLGIRGTTLCRSDLVLEEPACIGEGDDEDDFSPIGGDGMALLNLDYRFPIAGSFGGLVFVDFGNIWPTWRDINPTEAKVGAGVGVRYLSPIGPLRLEVGWKLEREPGESPYEIFLSFGNPF